MGVHRDVVVEGEGWNFRTRALSGRGVVDFMHPHEQEGGRERQTEEERRGGEEKERGRRREGEKKIWWKRGREEEEGEKTCALG